MVRGTSALSQSNEAKPHPLNLAEWRRLRVNYSRSSL
jgi:hypothetical protein